MPVELFGRPLNKADRRGGTLQVLPTVLTSLQNQLQANSQPDPTLGTPFASHVPFSDGSTVAQMGPGQPATPFPLGGEPRQWVYRVGWNFPTPPDSDRRIDGALLRQLADNTFLIRRAIEIRKTELSAMEWDIVPSRNALHDPRYGKTQRERVKAIRQKHGDTIREIREFFRYPEAYYTTKDGKSWVRKGEVSWKDWFNALIEEYFVGDWTTVWPQKTLGGKLLALRRVDGEHTKVLLSLDGRLPAPPMPAYQQYLYGVPRASFTQDDLYFWPKNLRNITPYGFSHVEQALSLILILLRYDQFNLAMYNDSTLPLGILESPEGLSADQIQDVADFLNGAVSTIADKMRVYPAPYGTKWQPIKPFTFDMNFANYVIDLACVAMDVTRQELGFSPGNQHALGGSGHAEAQSDLEKRKGRYPLAKWYEEKMTRVIFDHWGTTELEFRFTELITEDLNAKYDANDKAIRSGQISLDQVLEELGGESVGWGHMIETKAGIILPEQNILVTANGVLPIKPGATIRGEGAQGESESKGEPSPETVKKKIAEPSIASDERKKHEEEFIAAWLLLLNRKKEEMEQQIMLNSAQVRRAFSFSDKDVQELSVMMTTYRLMAFSETWNNLPKTPWDNPIPVNMNELIQREVDCTLERARGIADTWNSDVNNQADSIEATGADVEELKKKLLDWLDGRAEWKGRQISITEWTDAGGNASEDWASEHQSHSMDRRMRWRTAGDSKVCPACRAREGMIVDPKDQSPPLHPNCRCHLEPVGF